MADNNNGDATKKNAGDAKPAEAEQQGKQPSKEDKYAELKEQMLRLAAEFDNYKKRTKVDLDRAKSTGKAELAKSLLSILDEFELAMIAASGSSDKNVSKGIELVYSNLTDTLRRCGLREVPTDGIADPFKHEIIMVADSEKKPGTILEVVKKGYMFDDVMLRPASVIVAKEAKSAKQ
jgi:molecular chaperone GrpE